MFPMTIRFLRIFTFLMCAFTTGIVNARTLHVGNKTFALSQTKYTTPSLAFAVNNETWYGMLSGKVIPNTLQIKFNDAQFSWCEEPFTDTENYIYDENGNLIGADENLFIRSTSSAYINLNYTLTQNSRIVTKFYNMTTTPGSSTWATPTKWFFGGHYGPQSKGFGFGCKGGSNPPSFFYGTQHTNVGSASCNTLGIYQVDLNKNKITYTHPNGNTYSSSYGGQYITSVKIAVLAGMISTTPSPNKDKFYYMKVYNNGTLIRDMVPVPACMRIGDFIVPENGMWDIVEQKFYGNANTTGTIIYGRDE